MEKPILVYHKRADDSLNRIVIPKPVINRMGKYYYMEVFQDRIVLKPIKQEEYSGR